MFDQQGFFPPYLKIGISYKAKKESTFFYHFYISEYDFIYKYLTDSSGIVKTAAVQIPQFNFTYKYTSPLRHPLDIFTACRTFTAEASIHNIFSMFRHDLLNNFQSFIPEYESEIQTYSSEYSLGKSGINTHLLKNPPSETKRLILIIDDFFLHMFSLQFTYFIVSYPLFCIFIFFISLVVVFCQYILGYLSSYFKHK